MKTRVWMVNNVERLRELRKKAGLTQRQLADALYVNRNTYQNYEAGSTQPDFAILKKIAQYFNVTIDYLLGEEDANIVMITRKDFEAMKEAGNRLQSAIIQLLSITDKISTSNDQVDNKPSITFDDNNTQDNSN